MSENFNDARRAVVFAPFHSTDSAADRPRAAASALAQFMPVDLVTSDFDHLSKSRRTVRQCAPFARVNCLKVTAYKTNVSVARLLSHLLFALKAAGYFLRKRDAYDVVYVTTPLNLLAYLVLVVAGPRRRKIIDVVDIWPDSLPFSERTKRVLAPLFAVWKGFFKRSVKRADVVMTVSDSFLREAKEFANNRTRLRRFYIGQTKLGGNSARQPVFTIAYVGNLGHLYDFDALVDVLSEKSLRKSIQLFLIGKGDREEWLLAELERREIPYKHWGIVFDHGRLAEILRSCHIGFNGYIRTTASFSYKATTYLAAGLPLLNSMAGDLQQLVTEKRLGENYKGGDRQQLRDALLRLYDGGAARSAESCQKFFAEQLEEDCIMNEMEEFFANFLEKVRPLRKSSANCAPKAAMGV